MVDWFHRALYTIFYWLFDHDKTVLDETYAFNANPLRAILSKFERGLQSIAQILFNEFSVLFKEAPHTRSSSDLQR